MNKKEIRKNIVENMEKVVRFVRREKRIRNIEELWINKIRIDEENQIAYAEYEGKSRIGYILIDIVEKTRISTDNRLNCRNGDEIYNSCRNLVNHGNRLWIKDKNIVEFRFRKH